MNRDNEVIFIVANTDFASFASYNSDFFTVPVLHGLNHKHHLCLTVILNSAKSKLNLRLYSGSKFQAYCELVLPALASINSKYHDGLEISPKNPSFFILG